MYFACRGYGSERVWECIDEEEYYNQLTCTPEDEAPGKCYVCTDGKWSSQPDDVLNAAIGVCNYDGDIKKYDGNCGYWSVGEYFVCKERWRTASINDIPPGNCSEIGSKRRIDGVCYECGENKKWQAVDCV